MGMSPHQIIVGLDQALWEAGPNPVTDFADALEFEGKPELPAKARAEWEALRRFRDDLTKFLIRRNAAFIGGVAVRSFGGRVTATIEYEVLVQERLLKPITSFLESQGATLKSTVEDTYTFRVTPCAIDFDVRVARNPLDREALAKAKRASFQRRPLKVVRPAWLAAMKIKAYAGRKGTKKGNQDREDFLGLIDSGSTTLDEVKVVLGRHWPDFLDLLHTILAVH